MKKEKKNILCIPKTYHKFYDKSVFEKEYLPKIEVNKDVLDIQVIEDGYVFIIKNVGGVTFYPEINALLHHFHNKNYRPGIEWLKNNLKL